MAKVLVVDEEDPTIMIEVFSIPEDEPGGADGGWDGTCNRPGCEDYTISECRTRFNGLDDAVMEAMIHIDRRH